MLLRRARGCDPSQYDATLKPRALLSRSSDSVPGSIHSGAVTLTTQQHLVQQVLTTDAIMHLPEETQEDENQFSDRISDLSDTALDKLLDEMYQWKECMPDDTCLSSVERQYESMLWESAVSTLVARIFHTDEEPHTDASDVSFNVAEACGPLLTLCVKPTALARQLAFSLMYKITCAATLHACASSHEQTQTPIGQLASQLFAFFVDMLTKAVAVSSSATPPTSKAVSPWTEEDTWLLPAVVCLMAFTKCGSRSGYRHDRLRKLDAATLVFVLRRVVSLSIAHEANELQEELLEIVVCTMYAQHNGARGHNNSNSGGKSQPDTSTKTRLCLADVDRFGGVDLLLAIFNTTASDRSRRLLLVVFFDVTINQQLQKHNKPHDHDGDVVSFESLLCCLQGSSAAELTAVSPLSFLGTHVGKALSGAVENELLEKQVASVWNELRNTLQLEEYFSHSTALANTIAVVENTLQQQQHQQQQQQQQESLAEFVVAKTHQLIAASRLEDRFKGELWLAELLLYGLTTATTAAQSGDNDNASHQGVALLGVTGGGKAHTAIEGEVLEETFCFDEDAEMRQSARSTLWALAKSPSVGERLSFARVLSLFTRRRIRHGAPQAVVLAHIQELNQCFAMIVTQKEESVDVLMCLLETLLRVVSSYDVPYLEHQRRKYDVDSCESPQELIGCLVGSDSVAAGILRGTTSIDRDFAAAFSLEFLLYTMTVLDSAVRLATIVDGHDGELGGCVASLNGDYAAAIALVVSFVLDAPGSKSGGNGSSRTTESSLMDALSPHLDAYDTRVAVIMATTITNLVKRQYGDQRYYAMLRDLHASAVNEDDETLLTNEIAHARAMLVQCGKQP